MKKPILCIAMLLTSTFALADRQITMQNGGTCFLDSQGYTYGCSGGTPQQPANNPKAAEKVPETCIELEIALANIEQKFRSGYTAREGETMKSNKKIYSAIYDRSCR
jgi:hypothetical protein